MINIDNSILLKVFMPVLALSCCSGILLIGTMIYFFVFFYKRNRLFLTIIIMGTLGFIFTISEVFVIIYSLVQKPGTAIFFHRIEALTGLFFSFTLPMLLSGILELGTLFRKLNTIFYRLLLLISLIILICTIINPELFISAVKPVNSLITPWNIGRGAPGILYRIRDILNFIAVLYTFIFITTDIIINRQVRYLGWILCGIIIGTLTGVADMVMNMIEIHTGLFSTRIYSYFGFGLTICILLAMISSLKWFFDQTRDIDNAKKIESLGLFAGGIAHDFNNILTGILGNTSLLMNNFRQSEANSGLLSDIEKAVYRAKTLTMQLATFSRGGTPVKDITSIKNIVEDTTRFVLSGSDIKPRFYSDINLLNAEADAGQISQVIQNLVLNARDSMENKSGFIDISMENTLTVPSSLKKGMHDRYIKIDIKDHGTGISHRYIPYIFDPYFTTKNSGSGLGLSVSNSIIRKHGGEIQVKSKPDEGTTFTIFLPATTEKESDLTFESEIHKTFSGKILVMDDDQFLRPMLKKMLEITGLTAICVPDGESAISEFTKAKNSEEPFNAVIMDLTISGGMGGVSTSRKIREIDNSTPLIVASGYCDDPVMSDFKSYGFNERLIKPFTLDDLRKVIISILQPRN